MPALFIGCGFRRKPLTIGKRLEAFAMDLPEEVLLVSQDTPMPQPQKWWNFIFFCCSVPFVPSMALVQMSPMPFLKPHNVISGFSWQWTMSFVIGGCSRVDLQFHWVLFFLWWWFFKVIWKHLNNGVCMPLTCIVLLVSHKPPMHHAFIMALSLVMMSCSFAWLMILPLDAAPLLLFVISAAGSTNTSRNP